MSKELNNERDDWFMGILNDLHLGKYDIEDNTITYNNSKGHWMIEDWKNAVFCLSYYRIWSVLRSKYNMKYTDIQQYTKTMLLEHTNWNVKTTVSEIPISEGMLLEHTIMFR